MTSARFASIAHDIRERIALGEFGPNGSMESESELCSRYAVSRPVSYTHLDVYKRQVDQHLEVLFATHRKGQR